MKKYSAKFAHEDRMRESKASKVSELQLKKKCNFCIVLYSYTECKNGIKLIILKYCWITIIISIECCLVTK